MPARASLFVMRMNDAEAIMWAVEKDPALRSDFTNVTLLDRSPDGARLRAKVEQAVEAIPRLGERVVAPPLRLAPPEFRTDPTFDLDYHLRRVAVPAPGGLRELLDLAAAATAAPLDRSRPLWEFTLVEGLEDGRAALVQKVHHTVTDGVSGVRLSLSMLDVERDPGPSPGASTAQQVAAEAEAERRAGTRADPVDRTSPADVVADALRYAMRRRVERAQASLATTARLLTSPEDARRRAADTVALASSLRRQLLVGEPARSPLLDRRSLGCRFEATQVSLPGARQAAKALGGSINDLFVAGVAGALGAYHDRMGAPCQELRMAMPVNMRESDDQTAGNNFVPSRTLVPTGPKDPRTRFALVHERLAGLRDDPGLNATSSLAGLISPLPTSLLVSFARGQARTVDFVTSNLRGSPVDLYLAGARIEANFPMGPRAGCPVNVTTLSYRDSLDLGINLDPASVTDPGAFVECLDESFAELLACG